MRTRPYLSLMLTAASSKCLFAMMLIFQRTILSNINRINKPLWDQYQQGAITATQLQHQRFQAWAQRLSQSPAQLNSDFLAAMAEICQPLHGVTNLLNALRGRVKLGIITNGFTELQQVRWNAPVFSNILIY